MFLISRPNSDLTKQEAHSHILCCDNKNDNFKVKASAKMLVMKTSCIA